MESSRRRDLLDDLRDSFPGRERKTAVLQGFRPAAVLVPVIAAAEGPEFLLTKRTEDVETHKGQISFPGGMRDRDDASPEATALRETEEELGIEPSRVAILGLLDDIATPTGFVITPVVGLLKTLPPLAPNPAEVAETFTVPWKVFLDPANGRTEEREFLGESRTIWFYDTGRHIVWGATASIIHALLSRLKLL
jgi:8-oxo-dGTP pyrophosphatase MutT (NUDIX family)